jgi:lysozyme family protein
MARFEDAIGYVLDNEGGYAEHPSDPGGPTFWGISLRYLKGKGEKGDIDGDGDIDADDIRELTKAEAIEFYRKDFWNKLKLDALKTQAVACRVFDMAVNIGPRGAVKIAQRAFNGLLEGDDKEDRLKVDGKLGPKTRKALDSIDPVEMMDALRLFHAEFYRGLVKKNPQLKVFLDGWLRRAGR